MKVKNPIFVVDEGKARQNIKKMASKARQSGVVFRPHFKTHQSIGIGEWFKDEGVEAISVSSMGMARYFAKAGWRDISLCVPVNPNGLDDILALASRVNLHVLVESEEIGRLLAKSSTSLHAWIEVDVGYRRSGIPCHHREKLERVARILDNANHVSFQGILTHAGHAYHVRGKQRLRKVYDGAIASLAEARSHLLDAGISHCQVSYGDTPTCSIVDSFEGIDEIRPGNFIFYDLTQAWLGSCTEEDISSAVACPVIAKYPERGEFIIHGGGIHLSKEKLAGEKGAPDHHGKVCLLGENSASWTSPVPGVHVIDVSQEHGKVNAPLEFINRINLGDTMFVLPVHSCYAANLHEKYHTIAGKHLSSYHV
ncbi:alanine racemase [Candidatus Bathyarchaeota archaeon]|nr:alanine racemase [Candidatus Bathyarchaeota archaeon]